MIDGKDLVVLSSSRSSFYRLLSGIYYLELTTEQLEAIEAFRPSAEELGNQDIACGFTMMSHFLRTYLGDARQELAADFAHTILAIGAQNKRMALPYESVFTSAEGLLMQESRDDVYLTFRREGTALAQGTDLPEDHLSFMFEFVAMLCDRFAKCVENGQLDEARRNLQVQDGFIASHIDNWIDEYCTALEASARTEFYRGLALVTRGWMESDAAFRRELSEALADNDETKVVA